MSVATEDLGRAPIIPRTGASAALTVLVSAIMAALAVMALALGLAAGRLAERWDSALAGAVTLRIAVAAEDRDTAGNAARAQLRAAPGIADFDELDLAAQRALLAPWFGEGMPFDRLNLPLVFDISPEAGFDAAGLQADLQAELPGAVLDDHGDWREPLVAAAGGLRLLAFGAMALTGLAMAAVVALAAGFSMASHAQVIGVLRLIGARDRFISRAFTRRFTARAGIGAGIGTLVAMGALALVPRDAGGVLSGLGPQGQDWLAMLVVPLVAAAIAWVATGLSARRMLRRVD